MINNKIICLKCRLKVSKNLKKIQPKQRSGMQFRKFQLYFGSIRTNRTKYLIRVTSPSPVQLLKWLSMLNALCLVLLARGSLREIDSPFYGTVSSYSVLPL